MEKEKTHYRKAFNSPYLSSSDIVEPTVLTIQKVTLEPDKTKRTKDKFNTAYFTDKEIRKGEPLKPMILNAHNSRVMRDLTKSAFIDDWLNVQVTVYVDPNVRFGASTVEGLRISTEPPLVQKPVLEHGSGAWERAVAAYRRDGSFAAIEKHMVVSGDNKKLIEEEAKNVS